MKQRYAVAAVAGVAGGAAAIWKRRQSGGEQATTTRQDLVLAWLNDAYSMETSLARTLRGHANDAKDYPQLQTRLQQHVEETRRHADLVQGCIQRLGGGTSTVKRALGAVMGPVQGIVTRAARDTVVKNLLGDVAAEQLEIASYQSLVAAAEYLGDEETASICRQILQEEKQLAHFLAENVPVVTAGTLNSLRSSV